jgi:hypothetical protein
MRFHGIMMGADPGTQAYWVNDIPPSCMMAIAKIRSNGRTKGQPNRLNNAWEAVHTRHHVYDERPDMPSRG